MGVPKYRTEIRNQVCVNNLQRSFVIRRLFLRFLVSYNVDYFRLNYWFGRHQPPKAYLSAYDLHKSYHRHEISQTNFGIHIRLWYLLHTPHIFFSNLRCIFLLAKIKQQIKHRKYCLFCSIFQKLLNKN